MKPGHFPERPTAFFGSELHITEIKTPFPIGAINRSDHPFEMGGSPVVIRIQKGQPGMACQPDSQISCRRRSGICLPDLLEASGVWPTDRGGIISGTVIGHNNLPGLNSLSKDAFDRAPQKGGPVEGRNNYSDANHRAVSTGCPSGPEVAVALPLHGRQSAVATSAWLLEMERSIRSRSNWKKKFMLDSSTHARWKTGSRPPGALGSKRK